jgi:hypothetical protein
MHRIMLVGLGQSCIAAVDILMRIATAQEKVFTFIQSIFIPTTQNTNCERKSVH